MLDYKTGLLTINAPQAQGASGNLQNNAIPLRDISIQSESDNAHIFVVSLDGNDLSSSKRMLLQVMSEEKPTGFAAEEAGNGIKKITDIGHDPWQVKKLSGTVKFKTNVKIQPLDFNGYPAGEKQTGAEIKLAPATIYYLITR